MLNRYVLTSLLLGLFLSAHGAVATEAALQDPLRPVRYLAPAVEKTSPLEDGRTWFLSAVLHSAARSVAVINGQTLQVGDMFNGYKIVKIEAGKVLLRNKENGIVLHRAGTGLKKGSSTQDVKKGSRP